MEEVEGGQGKMSTYGEEDVGHGEEGSEGVEKLGEVGPFPMAAENGEVGGPERVMLSEVCEVARGRGQGRGGRGCGGSRGASRHRRHRRPTFLEHAGDQPRESRSWGRQRARGEGETRVVEWGRAAGSGVGVAGGEGRRAGW